MSRAALVRLAGLGLACAACSTGPSAETMAENARRDAFVRALLLDAGAAEAVQVGGSSAVHYESGFSIVELDPAQNVRSHAFRYMGQRGHIALRPERGRPMHLKAAGWVNERVVHARPRVSLSIDGRDVFWTPPLTESGIFVVDTVLGPTDAPWVDAILEVNAIGFHWGGPPELKVVVFTELLWEPAR